MKQEPTIQLCVKVPAHTADQIKKLAAANNIGIAEQLRQFIEKGLAVEGSFCLLCLPKGATQECGGIRKEVESLMTQKTCSAAWFLSLR